MKKFLLILSLLIITGAGYSQTTYYWVGGKAATTSISTGANWNTSLDGSGTARPSSTGATDVLVFDGTNVGGTSPATGATIVLANGSITCAQMKFVNNADISFIRTTTGTSTVTFSGGDGDDFFVAAGSKLSFTSTIGSVRMAMGTTTTGLVNGDILMNTTLQARFDNTPSGLSGTFRFTSGSSLSTNITSASSSYAFGSNSQSSEKWVVFEDGSNLYYNGGFSPMGNNSAFSAIEMKPGSTWHHRANNPTTGFGSFFVRRSFGNIIVTNNSTLTADGPIYRMTNLTIDAGSTFITHTSGQTAVLGNVTVNGTLSSPAGGINKLLLCNNAAQIISGSGSINVGAFELADAADVTLNTNMTVASSVEVYGKLNFNSNQINGDAVFIAGGNETAAAGTGNTSTGAYIITGNTGITTAAVGKTISSAGIATGTTVIALSSTNDSIYISHPLQATATGIALTISTSAATLATARGFDAATGSVITTGSKTFADKLNYIINGTTTTPFGISTNSSATMIQTGFVELNAAATANISVAVDDHFMLNGKFTLRSTDTLHLLSGAMLNGNFNSNNYIATDVDLANNKQSLFKYDAANNGAILPIGTTQYYLPVTITATGTADYTASVFEGITKEGTLNGTALIGSEKLTVVNAVWQINRFNGTGNADLQLNWNSALEGATFTTLPDTDIGIISNNGSSWSLPSGTANNTTNTATTSVGSFGSFSVGAIPQSDPFVFNPLPAKTYGDADFDGGATSLNTTQTIMYSSSNTSVVTIVNGKIHITSAGTTNITASQASDGFYPAASVTQSLTVTKASLLIKADNKTKFEGVAVPTLTATYTGFVLNETATVLLTPAVITTTATASSAPGTYPITVNGAISNNYTITFATGVLTVQPKQNQTITFNAPAVKTYGNTDFNANASSTNNTIPVTYTSSNTSVATINASGVIHISGAGTTTITVSQAGNDGYFPATAVARTLTVNKVNLTVRALDTSKVEGTANPTFTITYTGFVLGETVTNLTTAAEAVTTAGNSSIPGYYTISLQGAASQNYNLNYVSGRLTILPKQGTDQQYLNAYVNSTGNLFVRIYSPEPRLGDIMVYDMNGRPLVQRNVFMPVGFIQVEVFIPTLTTGMHVVTVKGDGVDLKRMIYVLKQ